VALPLCFVEAIVITIIYCPVYSLVRFPSAISHL